MAVGSDTNLNTPANAKGITTSPWRAKTQRIGLLNMTCKIVLSRQTSCSVTKMEIGIFPHI